MPRNRPTYMALVIIVITLGLLSRSSFMPKGNFIATYAGDTLYAVMFYLILCVIFPKWSSLKIAIYALAACFAIEFSQLCQQDWLNAIRHTRIGSKILGFGYKSSDLVCYTVGALIPYLAETFLCKKQTNSD